MAFPVRGFCTWNCQGLLQPDEGWLFLSVKLQEVFKLSVFQQEMLELEGDVNFWSLTNDSQGQLILIRTIHTVVEIIDISVEIPKCDFSGQTLEICPIIAAEYQTLSRF